MLVSSDFLARKFWFDEVGLFKRSIYMEVNDILLKVKDRSQKFLEQFDD
jgi:hypothetical protein